MQPSVKCKTTVREKKKKGLLCTFKEFLHPDLSIVILTFNEGEKLFMLDSVPLDVDLQGEQQGEQELVFFIQAPGRILMNLIGHMLNDISNPLARNWAFDRPGGGNQT